MEITDIETIRYTYESRRSRDEKGHGHPGEPHEAVQTLTRVVVDGGPDGLCFGGTRAASRVV